MWKESLKRKRNRRVRSRTYNPTIQKRINRSEKIAKYTKLMFIGVVILMVIGFILIPILSLTLPAPDNIERAEGFSTKILDRNGEVLYDIYTDQRRTPVQFEDIPDYLKQATIAVEDKNFYHHQGFDFLGLLRGLSRFFTQGRAQGGSTLTQQVVKNVLLSPERTVTRKLREFILALQVESRYSKDEILLLYLNEVPYGGTAWGVEAASEMYFGKSVKDLNLVECAFLAGLPQRPTVYSPFSSTPDAYIGRTEQVLRRMREDGYITAEQEEESKNQLPDMEFISRGASFKAPHFVQYVQDILVERYGESAIQEGGLQVTTTLDLSLQEKAQEIVADEIASVESLDISNGAAVVLDPQTGEILAMIGSKDFNATDYDGQVNVTTSLRQPGSAIKPITYVTALEKGYTPSTLIMDVPTKFPGGADNPDYEPVNYDGEYRGPIQLRYALANSINVPAVKMLALVGIRDTLDTAYNLGLSSLKPDQETLNRVGLSLTLGGGEVRLIELTGAYAAFMNEGYKIDPTAILKIEDLSGKVLEENKPEKGKQVLSPEHAYLIADILSDNNARSLVFGTNSLLHIPGREIAVKTGTTNDKRDNWTIGGNSQVVVGVWVGNNDNSAMRSVASGVTGASPIWRNILLEALSGKPNVTFEQPPGIVTASVDEVSGYRAHDNLPSRTEKFAKGTEPGEDPVHVLLKVCKGEGKLATPSDIAANNYEEKEYFVFKEEDPTAGPGEPNRWQEGILGWIAEHPDEKYNPPTEYCGGVNRAPLNVEFISPRDRDSNLDNDITIKFTADSIYKITEMKLEIDGVNVRSYTGPPFEYQTNLDDGVHELRAIARDEKGNESDRRITIGVNTEWNSE